MLALDGIPVAPGRVRAAHGSWKAAKGSQIGVGTEHGSHAVLGGLQWQTLKYLMRIWLKGNALQDAKKARWYLDRLISKLGS
jgi:hypothetical protein